MPDLLRREFVAKYLGVCLFIEPVRGFNWIYPLNLLTYIFKLYFMWIVEGVFEGNTLMGSISLRKFISVYCDKVWRFSSQVFNSSIPDDGRS